MNATPTVFIVDDDAAVRDSMALMLQLKGFQADSHESAEAFLESYEPGTPGCIVLDMRMTGMNGLEMQRSLTARNINLPVIFMTAYGDVQTTRSALKGGALDFLEKPVDEKTLIDLVSTALAMESAAREAAEDSVSRRLDRLSVRERQVLDSIVAGRHNREIAEELAISVRTVEVYKARMMEKMRVTRVPELVKLMLPVDAAAPTLQ